MKVGDLIRFKATVHMAKPPAIYLGLVDEMYTFWTHKYGKIEFWKGKFNLEDKVEVISEGRR